jgi:hypothetical protein
MVQYLQMIAIYSICNVFVASIFLYWILMDQPDRRG